MRKKYIILGEIDIQPLISTRDFFHEALHEAKSKLEIAGTIQAFEVCYDITWKTLKKVLYTKGIEVFSPRETFRLAAREGLITNLRTWLDYVKKRNITAHEYHEEIMEKVYPVLPKFLKDLNTLIKKMEKL